LGSDVYNGDELTWDVSLCKAGNRILVSYPHNKDHCISVSKHVTFCVCSVNWLQSTLQTSIPCVTDKQQRTGWSWVSLSRQFTDRLDEKTYQTLTVSWCLLSLTQIKLHIHSNHIIVTITVLWGLGRGLMSNFPCSQWLSKIYLCLIRMRVRNIYINIRGRLRPAATKAVFLVLRKPSLRQLAEISNMNAYIFLI
jgi:hypothetical protein